MEKMDQLAASIKAVLSERLDCYALIGFDTEGNEVRICHTPNDLAVRAVNDGYRDWYEEQQEVLEGEFEWENGWESA